MVYKPLASHTEKKDKRFANRKHRRAVKHAILIEEEVMPELREVSNKWDFAKDGYSQYTVIDCQDSEFPHPWWEVVRK